ncbi:MAG: phospholipid carrier-dependent glycosyltransferase [Patescibacteria group bacterium]|nr:phospholipid carrier-dependent glycosyltransferase [Patescibacteria group bacterium]
MHAFKKALYRYPIRFLLLGILVLALFLRFWDLGGIPAGLHDDEVANAYVGKYSLIHGVDLYGNPFPLLYFDKFGDYPPVLPMYLSGAGALLFGDTVFGARFFHALAGAVTIVPAYLLGLLVFRRKKTALLAAFFTALLPWHLVLSRTSAEGVVASFVFLCGIVAVLCGISRSSTNGALIAVGGFTGLMLTYLLYPGYRVIVPLALLPLPLMLAARRHRKPVLLAGLLAVVVAFAATGLIFRTEWGKGRFQQTSIFTSAFDIEGKLQRLIFNEDSILIARIFNNKVVGYSRGLVESYLTYWSPGFLFFEEGQSKHYSVPMHGVAYLVFIPLLLAIVRFVWTQKEPLRIRSVQAWFFWLLLIAPIPAALTATESPNIHRSLPFGLLLTIAAAYGFTLLERFPKPEYRKRRIPVVEGILAVVLAVEVVFFMHAYYQHASMYTAPFRNSGNKELVEYLVRERGNYGRAIISNDQRWLPVHYLYYTSQYPRELAGTFGKNFRVSRLDNLEFSEIVCPTVTAWESYQQTGTVPDPSVLYVEPIGCKEGRVANKYDDRFTYIETIKRTDFSDAFYVLRWNVQQGLRTRAE